MVDDCLKHIEYVTKFYLPDELKRIQHMPESLKYLLSNLCCHASLPSSSVPNGLAALRMYSMGLLSHESSIFFTTSTT